MHPPGTGAGRNAGNTRRQRLYAAACGAATGKISPGWQLSGSGPQAKIHDSLGNRAQGRAVAAGVPAQALEGFVDGDTAFGG
jgi:hypothetical protein